MTRGRFIVFEGGEASGKSTQAARLAARLGAELTREPGGTELGEQVRELVLAHRRVGLDPRAELFLFLAARAAHVDEVIGPALSSGRDVVCDRFDASTLAYQGYGRGLPLDEVATACQLSAGSVRPDLYVLLDLDPVMGAARRGERQDRIESAPLSFHEAVRAGFLALATAEPDRWIVVDGVGTIDEVSAKVDRALDGRLGDRDRAPK